jgi:hypothetical protein
MSSINKNDENSDSKSNPSSLGSNNVKFLISVLYIAIFIVIYFFYGGLILYGCKIAQSNILPTNTRCFPYTDSHPNIQQIKTNIFTTFTDQPMSMKLSIPNDTTNSKNIIIDILRNYKNEPDSSSIGNFFVSLIESLISFNYSSMNTILNLCNYLPESLIILFGPIIITMFSTMILLFDNLYLIYLWFSNFFWFFKQNVNTEANHKPEWESVTILQPINYWIAIGFVFWFFILFFFVAPLLFPFLSFFTMTWCFFSSFGYKGVMNPGLSNQKSVGSTDIVKDVFKYYKVLVMSIFSFFVIQKSFTSLGTMPGVFCLIILLLIIFGIFSIDMFKSKAELNLTPLVSTDQAKKSCSLKSEKPKGFFSSFYSQDGGKKIIKELKLAGDRLNKK